MGVPGTNTTESKNPMKHEQRKTLFRAGDLHIGEITDADLSSSLEVYRQSEDFLALGPVAKASKEMLLADIDHSRESHGVFCGIWSDSGSQIGVIDFIPNNRPATALLGLLMISRECRNRGFGTQIIGSLESYLSQTYGTKVIESGVQTNNQAAIRFWKRHGFRLQEVGKEMDDGTVVYHMSKEL
jgi:RimJ/RimL family protein N-acetyltransferase